MSKTIRISAASIGSDESGTGGLFGGCAFAAFKITKSSFQKLQKFDWLDEILKIRDSKKFSEERCQELCDKITKEFKKGKDFEIIHINPNIYNENLKELGNQVRVKCQYHGRTHKNIEENASFHVADHFFEKTSQQYYDFFKEINSIAVIDKFFKKGEFKLLSISIASIIARGTHLKEFYGFTKRLGINLSDKDNHNLPSTKIEPILNQLKETGIPLDFLFKNYCKLNIIKKYNQRLLSCKNQETKI